MIGDPTKPWNYISGYSDDGTHPNSAAVEVMIPLARVAIQSVRGGR